MATARKKRIKGYKCSASSGHIINLKQSIFLSISVIGMLYQCEEALGKKCFKVILVCFKK
jgi:hypothetical protein